MEGRRPFRLYLSSDSSKSFFTSTNSRTDFWVHLANPIRLDGDWEVGVTELFTTKAESAQDSALFLYCNIGVQVPVSDSMIRCLRVLPPLSDKDPNIYRFDRPYFERVEFPDFQDIRFRLLDRLGALYRLASTGVVTHIVLWFRPVS